MQVYYPPPPRTPAYIHTHIRIHKSVDMSDAKTTAVTNQHEFYKRTCTNGSES